MPWKDPNNWLTAELMAPLLSFVLAMVRAVYQNDQTSWPRRVVEATLCGFVTLTATYAIEALGAHGDWKYAVAGGVGFLGVDYIRSIAKRLIERRIEKA